MITIVQDCLKSILNEIFFAFREENHFILVGLAV